MILKTALGVLVLSAWIPANAANSDWVAIQAASNDAQSSRIPIKAVLFEDQALPLKSDVYVGNLAVPANERPRKLVVEAGPDIQTGKSKKWAFVIPSNTQPEDECSVTEIHGLSIKGAYLSVTLDYQAACGAGSAVEVTHTLLVGEQSMRYEKVELEASSRDGISTRQLDFRKGKITRRFERPEDDAPGAARQSSFKPHLIPIDSQTFVRCPYPLHGREMPDCESKSTYLQPY